MFKLMNKKLLGKKGFTLAELLVVIAILAILIAIAVPVFTHMVAEANLRVNQANVHSVRSAAVAYILTNLGESDMRGTKLNTYITEDDPDHYWVATANVDNNGNISNLQVLALSGKMLGTGIDKNKVEGISINSLGGGLCFYEGAPGFYEVSDDLEEQFATVKPSMGFNKSSTDTTKVYVVQAVITDLTN